MTIEVDLDQLSEDARAAMRSDSNGDIPPGPRLLTIRELEEMPEPRWLVKDLLAAGTLATLYGPPGEGKTFAALGLALSIASGREWHGKTVERGLVIYVAAEGALGLRKRVMAWRRDRDVDPDDPRIRFAIAAVNLLDQGATADFARSLDQLNEPPALLIVDTLARSMVGGEENSARDVGVVVAAADRLRGGGAALLLHHAGKQPGQGARGSSALKGAMDTELFMRREGDDYMLTVEKQKDAPAASPIHLRLDPVEGTGSCVLRRFEPAGAESREDRLHRLVLEVVEADPGASSNQICTLVGGRKLDTLNALREHIDNGKVVVKSEGQKRAHYLVETPNRFPVPTGSQPVPEPVARTGSPVPSPLGGTGTGADPDVVCGPEPGTGQDAALLDRAGNEDGDR